MTDTPSTAQPFTVAGVTFRCWIADGEPNELGLPTQRYEWRTDDGRCRLGRNAGNRMFWAMCDDRDLGTHFQSLMLAMAVGARAAQRQAA